MIQLTNELEIHATVDDTRVVITMLLDANGMEVADPERAVIAVGCILEGPNAGALFVSDEFRQISEIQTFRLH